MLDLGEGDLAARRGDWPSALARDRNAYENQRTDGGTLRFTPASYMIKLAEANLIWPSADAPRPSGGDSHRTARALEHLAAARRGYEDERSWAVREDRRLETHYYSRVLEARLHQLDALTPCR